MKFENEAAMQAWLSERLPALQGLSELILNPKLVEQQEGDPLQAAEVRASFRYCLPFLNVTRVVTENEDISLTGDEVLKPDFVLYALEQQGLILMELKNLVGPSRNAGTEAGAYAGELRAHLPFIADGDVVSVIVSSVWPTLLRHYAAHEILWIGRNIICLEPVELPLGFVGLNIVDPLNFNETLEAKVSQFEMGGYHLGLEDHHLYGHGDRARLDPYAPIFRSTLQMMATRGNALRSHGFALLWKDRWTSSLTPYCITLVHAAPFQGAAKPLMKVEDDKDLAPFQRKLINLARHYDPAGQSAALEEIAEVARKALSGVARPKAEGFLHWGALRNSLTERAEHIAFAGWGRFGNRYAELQIARFAANHFAAYDDTAIGFQVIGELITEIRPLLPSDLGYYGGGYGSADDEDEFT